MNYEEMTDFEINKAVAEAKGLKIKNMQCASLKVHSSSVLAQDWMTGRYVELNYCKNPSDAWPIIMDKKIGGHYGKATPGLYFAVSRCEKYVHADSNPLRAYMIVYLRMNEDNGEGK